ncbi:zinc-dependent metalloprotease [Novosphingobium profundi]|uniref:zinc-dependent metalloprotease n=1 Tax=Novosphingobium profundi TaxID=1774954 RepID=UPI001BDA79B0|nr:zinc-dependent metalloprotease [Novosphingobium profundi]MBT0670074.1 zinc-dependent metalloprotease [Novosphingobium profundi]
MRLSVSRHLRGVLLAGTLCAPLLAGVALPHVAHAQVQTVASTSDGTLLPVRVDKQTGQVLVTLPAPDAQGVSGRYLYATALKVGLGSAPVRLDHGMLGETHVLAFRRYGRKMAITFENPRFRASGPAEIEQGARQSFPFSTLAMVDIVATAPDGSATIDLAPFLASDTMNIAQALGADAPGWKLDPALSVADPSAVKVFPKNVEFEAVQTFVNDKPGREVGDIAPESRKVSFVVHHSLVELPGPGFQVRRLDIRSGAHGTQVYDFGTPLGQDVEVQLANHFRLDKIDPAAPRSKVKKPIVFYIDSAAPEPIRTALATGVAWWNQAFEAAGFIDAFQVKTLPPGADPQDVRYNVVNWGDRLTRSWSYGGGVIDPRTGEIIKGNVVLGALRVRQDVILYESLVGTAQENTGGPQDPVRIALARLSQLGAHEVGHAIGFVHNFEGSTQDRTSVMDYPIARMAIRDGAIDLSDAYASGIGSWDKFTVDWLYGQGAPGTDPEGVAKAKADAIVASGMRFMTDIDGRSADLAVPGDSMWTEGADEAPDLLHILNVRRIALGTFGPGVLHAGEPMADLRRKFVPLWLLHRYEVDAVGKLLGGVEYTYALAGDGSPLPAPATAEKQEAALDALLETLSEKELTVPARLLPLLTSGQNGRSDAQYDVEVLDTAGAGAFDPLVAADVGAQVTLTSLLAPARLQRIYLQHQADTRLPGLDEVLDKLVAATLGARTGAVGRRIATRTLVSLARAARDPATPADVAAILGDRLHAIAADLAATKGPGEDARWARGTAAMLSDKDALTRALAPAASPQVPQGMPI